MKKKEKKQLRNALENLHQSGLRLSNMVWNKVGTWNSFNKRSLGETWVKTADSLSSQVQVLRTVKLAEEKTHRIVKLKAQYRKHEDILEKARVRNLLTETEYKEIKEKYEGWYNNFLLVKIIMKQE